MISLGDSGLPSPDVVLQYGSITLSGLLAAVGALAAESLWAKRLSPEEQDRRRTELNRRTERLRELIKAVENSEAGDHRDDENVGQIKFEMVLQRCREVEQLAPEMDNFKALEEGFAWCAKLLHKELRIATKSTLEGQDLEYSDGTKLDKLLGHPEALERVSQRARCPIPASLQQAIFTQARQGEAVRRAQKRTHVRKAFALLFRAKETWPWVVANNLVAVVSGVLSTVALDYHAELLETFRHPRFTQRHFYHVAAAWAMVELCTHLMGVLGSQLSARGEKVASRILQVQLFRAITKQELPWWEKKSEADVGSLEGLVRHRMPYEVSKVLNIPRDYVHRVASVAAAAWRVRQRSNRLLYLMVGIHWASVFSRKAVRWLRACAQERAYRGVVMPSQDDRTFLYALRPEYATLYQSFVRSPKETRLFEQFVADHQRFEQRMMSVGQILDPADKMVREGSIISQIAAVGGLVQQGVASDGQARALMHHATEITREIEITYNDWVGSQEKCSELAKAYDIITMAPKINPEVGLAPTNKAAGSIVFEDVVFEYPNRKGSVLKGVSFQVSPGQVAGIVGKTGCGKTTVFRLVGRFYDVTGGKILLDGRNIREYSPEWLRAQIATVSQEPEMIPLTIRDNITIGCQHDPSVLEIEEACRAANIWDVLNDKDKFPEGLQTKMRKVKNISGGEKQRICIARAILANPPILLLDEATSALDKETESMVQEALEKLMRGRTTLVIAHRLSTICDSHVILGMKDGKVVEHGTHEELLQTPDDAENCVYGRLWREQLGGNAGPSRSSDLTPQNNSSSPQDQLRALKTFLADATRTRDLEKAKRGLLEVLSRLQLQSDQISELQASVEVRRCLQGVQQEAQQASLVQAGQSEDVTSIQHNVEAGGDP